MDSRPTSSQNADDKDCSLSSRVIHITKTLFTSPHSYISKLYLLSTLHSLLIHRCSKMGKGGQQHAVVSTRGGSITTTTTESQSRRGTPDDVWKSSYNPLDANAPALPTKSQIRAVIPPHCFERSYVWSMLYLCRDFAMAAGFAYAASHVVSTDLPSLTDGLAVFLWVASWGLYAFWMGTILTGPWVLAHECGHGAFSPNQTWNDVVGFIVHQALLVPYFAWQYTHAKHHRPQLRQSARPIAQ